MPGVVAGHPPRPGLLTGGQDLDDNRFAFHTDVATPNQYVVIDLGKPMTISRIWIENRRHDLQGRAKGMTLSLSLQPNVKSRVIWTAENIEKEWTIALPRKTKARYITIKQAEKSTEALHLAQVKVFGWEK